MAVDIFDLDDEALDLLGIERNDAAPASPMGSLAAMTVTEDQLADLLGVDPRAVSLHRAKGVIQAPDRRHIPLRAALRAYSANLREVAAGRGGSSAGLTAARERKERAAAETAELRVAAARRSLLPADEVERTWSDTLRNIRSAVLALPSRVGARLSLPPADVDVIDRECREVLTELSHG